MNYKSVTARWNVQQLHVVYRKSMQFCNCKVPIGCSSKNHGTCMPPGKKKIGTLTWTNLKNNLSQLGSIPAINKTTLKPPNTHICTYMYISDDMGTWDPHIFTNHFFENSFKTSLPQSCIFFWGLIDSHVSNWQTTAPSCHLRVWEGKWHLGIFFWSQTCWGVLSNHGNLT